MGINKQSLIYALLIGFSVACFSQSCGSMKGATLLPSRNVMYRPVKPPVMDLKIRSDSPSKETYAKPEESQPKSKTGLSVIDTILSSQNLMLRNQNKSLDNEGKMLDILRSKDLENKQLKSRNADLNKKSEVAKEVKNDALIQNTVWNLGKYILLSIAGLYVLGIIIILILTSRRSNAHKTSA